VDLTPDRMFITSTLVDLVRINSINPRIAPDGAGEAEIAAYVARTLAWLGLDQTTFESQPGRVTAMGTLRGTGGGGSLMLNGHADTVGIEGMTDPFSAQIRDGRLYGRGAHDMKGSLAACIGAAKILADAGVRLRGDLVIAAVADEEYGSLGTADLIVSNSLRLTAAALVLTLMAFRQPGGLKLRGFGWKTLGVIALSGVIGTALGSALYLTAVTYAGAGKASALQTVAPFFAAPLALIFLKERINRATLIGTALSVVGVWLLIGF